MYPERVVLPYIFWKTAPGNCSIVGSIPAPLLSELNKQHSFESITEHIQSLLTSPVCATFSDPMYCAFCYDMMKILTANHEDTRFMLNRGLTVGD